MYTTHRLISRIALMESFWQFGLEKPGRRMDQITHVGWNLLESSSFSQSIVPLGSSDSKNNHLLTGEKQIFLYISPKGPSPASRQQVIELVYLSQEQAAVL